MFLPFAANIFLNLIAVHDFFGDLRLIFLGFFAFAFFSFASSSVNRARLFDKNIIVQQYSKPMELSKGKATISQN